MIWSIIRRIHECLLEDKFTPFSHHGDRARNVRRPLNLKETLVPVTERAKASPWGLSTYLKRLRYCLPRLLFSSLSILSHKLIQWSSLLHLNLFPAQLGWNLTHLYRTMKESLLIGDVGHSTRKLSRARIPVSKAHLLFLKAPLVP